MREHARQRRRSIAAEVVALLEEGIVTEKEWEARKEFLRKLQRMRQRKARAPGSFPSTEAMQRKDRAR